MQNFKPEWTGAFNSLDREQQDLGLERSRLRSLLFSYQCIGLIGNAIEAEKEVYADAASMALTHPNSVLDCYRILTRRKLASIAQRDNNATL